MLVQRWCKVHGFYDVGPTVFRCGCVGWGVRIRSSTTQLLYEVQQAESLPLLDELVYEPSPRLCDDVTHRSVLVSELLTDISLPSTRRLPN